MKRRNFLKIIGSSCIIVAASGGTAGYFLSEPGVSYPDEPWHSAGSPYEEPRMRALSYAILAPNPHNRQPWLIQLDDRMGITLYCQLDRRLPETDPYDRQIMIGLGCFCELLRMAAAEDGFDAQIQWFPEGLPDGNRLSESPVAHIELVKGASADPLFKQVLNRRSTKEVFDISRQVDDNTLAALKDNDSEIQTSNDAELVAKLRNLTMDAFMVEIETARTYKESVDLMRIGNKEVAAKPDGISMGGAFFSVMKNTGLISRKKIADPSSQAYKQGISPFRDIMHSAMAYSWISTSGNTRLNQVEAGRQYLRLNLKAAELGLSMHPISQALQEYPEMAMLYKELHELTDTQSPGRIQMLTRLGYGPQVGFSPRWSLKTRIKT